MALTIGALASLGVLVLYFHPWLVVGVAIDLFVLWVALVAHWAPGGVAVASRRNQPSGLGRRRRPGPGGVVPGPLSS